MPSTTTTARLPQRILAWLAENPGEHRARDVAAALTPPDPAMTTSRWSQKVANALGRLAREQDVVRVYRDVGYEKPVGFYTAKQDGADA